MWLNKKKPECMVHEDEPRQEERVEILGTYAFVFRRGGASRCIVRLLPPPMSSNGMNEDRQDVFIYSTQYLFQMPEGLAHLTFKCVQFVIELGANYEGFSLTMYTANKTKKAFGQSWLVICRRNSTNKYIRMHHHNGARCLLHLLLAALRGFCFRLSK